MREVISPAMDAFAYWRVWRTGRADEFVTGSVGSFEEVHDVRSVTIKG